MAAPSGGSRTPRGPRKGQGGRPRVVAGRVVRNAVGIPTPRTGEPEALPILPGCRTPPLETTTLPPRRGAELLRVEAQRLKIAQELGRGRQVGQVAETLGLSRTLVWRVWTDIAQELHRKEPTGIDARVFDPEQRKLVTGRAKLQDIADRFHAGWRLSTSLGTCGCHGGWWCLG
jgi:hypothetical protein